MLILRHYVIAFSNTLDVNKTETVILRELANQDVEEVIDHYLVEGAEQAALGFRFRKGICSYKSMARNWFIALRL